ncbi:IS3 family transposase [Sinanaerobacter sp. ZZT-01]|uniref:IS3 family transposase n=1 Tax=Sinanaerobacter sp. ZZT-01 TaxID=3111540 RepID=UPI002D785E69|nr:IS3 family transposase [Sinanaerobacter sp. ZZT-01]WRR95119.1 IS3 family transposase [Sinanaerobacter sp. ZZT-01]
MAIQIITLIYDVKRRYGAPKIHQILLSNGWHVSLKRVQRRMETLGIRSIVIKIYRHYSNQNSIIEKENILKQDFTATAINQKWCTDITYIHTQKNGWTYLASVMDFYSKKIIGWAFDTTMSAELAVKAINNACLNVKNSEGIILQSDLGTQYTSELFERTLAKKKIRHSFSRKGCPYDNACIESLHSLLKKEEVYCKIYKDSSDAYKSIFEYIESWYNQKRIHSILGYKTPNALHVKGVA